MEVVEPPSKTRPRFQYTLLEEYPLPLPAADEDDPLDVLRTRVFRWAKDRGRKLGDFRSPQWTSRGYVLVGKCVKHTDCHAGKGRHFKFRGGQAENLRTYILSVWTSGTCSGEDRVLRPTVACGTGPTHQDREDVLHIADQLLARNVPCTPTNVSGQLKRLLSQSTSLPSCDSEGDSLEGTRRSGQPAFLSSRLGLLQAAMTTKQIFVLRGMKSAQRCGGSCCCVRFGRSYRNFFQNPFWMWRSGLTW